MAKIWVLITLMLAGVGIAIMAGFYLGHLFVWGGIGLLLVSSFLLGWEVGKV